MGQIVNVSKTVNDTVESTLRKVVSAIKELGFELENVDSRNGTVVCWTKGIGMKFKLQCVIFDQGDGSTMCTIRTVDYKEKGLLTQWGDNVGLFINSRKHSQKILDRL